MEEAYPGVLQERATESVAEGEEHEDHQRDHDSHEGDHRKHAGAALVHSAEALLAPGSPIRSATR